MMADTNLESMPPEILYKILQYISSDDLDTLKRLQLGSIQQVVHRVINCEHFLSYKDSMNSSLQNCEWNTQEVLDVVQHIYIGGPNRKLGSQKTNAYESFLEEVEPFNGMLRRVKNLKLLSWRFGPVPHTLLDTLEKHHPRAKLRVFSHCRFDETLPQLHQSEIALRSFKNLTFFTAVDHTMGGHRQSGYGSASFLAILRGHKTIRHASFLSRDSRLHHELLLDEEIIDDADFTSKSCVKSLTLDGSNVKFSAQLLNEIGMSVDLSKIESIKCSKGSFELDYFTDAPRLLPNIKSISLNFATLRSSRTYYNNDNELLRSSSTLADAARDYVLNANSLTALSLWAWADIINVDQLINRHGSTLRTLSLHERQLSSNENYGKSSRIVLARAQVETLRNNCPQLRDLTLDITLPDANFILSAQPNVLEILDEIAPFGPPLKHLQIYFESNGLQQFCEETDQTRLMPSSGSIGDLHKQQDTDTKADSILRQYVEAIWKRVFGTLTTGERILTIKIGEWESNLWEWSQDNKRRFYVAVPHERDDMVGECNVTARNNLSMDLGS